MYGSKASRRFPITCRVIIWVASCWNIFKSKHSSTGKNCYTKLHENQKPLCGIEYAFFKNCIDFWTFTVLTSHIQIHQTSDPLHPKRHTPRTPNITHSEHLCHTQYTKLHIAFTPNTTKTCTVLDYSFLSQDKKLTYIS